MAKYEIDDSDLMAHELVLTYRALVSMTDVDF